MKDIAKLNSQLYRNTKIYNTNEFKDIGILGGQFIFIMCIFDNPGKSQDWVAEELKMNKSTVARVIAELEHQELVTRTQDENDKRIYILEPTEKCNQIYPEIKKRVRKYNKLATEGLSTEEKATFLELLEKVNKNIANQIKNRRES